MPTHTPNKPSSATTAAPVPEPVSRSLSERLASAGYQLLLTLAFPAVLLRLWWRGRKEPEYRARIAERLGHVPASVKPGAIWLHSVSAGETNAMAPLVQQLQQRFPAQHFLVTTMTPTGSAQVQRILGDSVSHCYAPYDFSWAVRRFYQLAQPQLLVLMETELWPNLTAAAAKRRLPVLLINARLSARSAAGYARISALTRPMLAALSALACQEREHQTRFEALGSAPARTQTLGSIKFDKALPEDHRGFVQEYRKRWQLRNRWVWLAASTHPGEDEIVLRAHGQLLSSVPDALLILVPRHPVRADDVLALAQQQGLDAQRQQALAAFSSPPSKGLQVIVADTMGQLQNLYGLAHAAFIGGSLMPIGGHDPIEAALWQIPMAMGPQRFNFPMVCEAFAQVDALQQTDDAAELAQQLLRWHQDDKARQAQGAAGAAVIAANTGAAQRTFELLEAQIERLG